MTKALLLSLIASLGLPAAAAPAPARGPGINYYISGAQQMLSFESILQLEPELLTGKLKDIVDKTDWIKSYGEPPFNNPKLYADIVRETIGQGKAVLAALKARKSRVDSCDGLEVAQAAECTVSVQRANADLDRRIQIVSAFVASFEKDAAALPKP
jgi:hypothetical protein